MARVDASRRTDEFVTQSPTKTPPVMTDSGSFFESDAGASIITSVKPMTHEEFRERMKALAPVLDPQYVELKQRLLAKEKIFEVTRQRKHD